eukprot:GEMP01056338.1.p2 GENE.GEMP01056338.1~~GEMP01056338.1.p2  ORF type:complete len:191 (-),score=39.51 GEMP01056338.1:852-1424(-)
MWSLPGAARCLATARARDAVQTASNIRLCTRYVALGRWRSSTTASSLWSLTPYLAVGRREYVAVGRREYVAEGRRRFATAEGISRDKIASVLMEQFPMEDPLHISRARLNRMFQQIGVPLHDHESILEDWKKLKNEAMYEGAFEVMADSGEQCDGELPSRSRLNMQEAGFAEADVEDIPLMDRKKKNEPK